MSTKMLSDTNIQGEDSEITSKVKTLFKGRLETQRCKQVIINFSVVCDNLGVNCPLYVADADWHTEGWVMTETED